MEKEELYQEVLRLLKKYFPYQPQIKVDEYEKEFKELITGV